MLKFYDINAYLGKSLKGTYKPAVSGAGLLSSLKASGISKALAWHIAAKEASPVTGNRMLAELIKEEKDIYGCWVILPPATGEIIKKDFFKQMKNNRIFAVRVFPGSHCFVLKKAAFGGFFEELTERRIPLLFSVQKEGKGLWNSIYDLLEDFPKLTCIICDTGDWGSNRFSFPLLEKYKNVYLETSMLSLQKGCVELITKKYGSKRLVYGSSFPECYPESGIAQVMFAPISQTDKENIAFRNFEKLMAGVQL